MDQTHDRTLKQENIERWALTVRGIVQGVGFRPFVYRLAIELGLTGWVNNTVQGVMIEIEGDRDRLMQFQTRLEQAPPPQAQIDTITQQTQPLQHDPSFTIHTSPAAPGATLQVTLLPDLATCADCLRELNDPGDRRYRYPFLNCTNCGPRFSILRDLPYDRPHTTMRDFGLCPDCQAEYENPLDRRFHAQPVACPVCGPQLNLRDRSGSILAQNDAAMDEAIERLQRGEILAVKGLGGFHLFADARNQDAVATLRQRKQRPDKPFALMYPSLELIAQDCELTEAEHALLTSAIAPIVLLQKRRDRARDRAEPSQSIAPNVAPSVPDLGVMLPHSPLHHVLMQGLGFPVVATSANRSGEPLCITGEEVLERLGEVIDAVVDHDRPIARPLDDSITRVIRVHHTTRTQVLRHGRGYAPSTLMIPQAQSIPTPPLLAVGAHLKNAIALSDGQRLILSQYIGDLDTPATVERLQTTIEDLLRLYRIQPEAIACDAHPDYVSTQLAHQLAQQYSAQISSTPPISVQHHHAHALACIAEHGITTPTLAIAWDGTGYGLDGTVWGGEWLRIDPPSISNSSNPSNPSNSQGWQRVAHWRSFPLPGGEMATREPRRSALGWLWSVFGDDLWTLAELGNLPTIAAFAPTEQPLLKVALNRRLNTPQTSSVGRMFDAVASLLGLHQRCSFEGQGAIAVEALARSVKDATPYPISLVIQKDDQPLIVDSSELLRGIVQDCWAGVDRTIIAARFQQTLVEAITLVTQRLDLSQVVLTGGCFQNRTLTEDVIQRLDGQHFEPSGEPIRVHIHQRIPPNDGGLAIGQILAAWRSLSSPLYTES